MDRVRSLWAAAKEQRGTGATRGPAPNGASCETPFHRAPKGHIIILSIDVDMDLVDLDIVSGFLNID